MLVYCGLELYYSWRSLCSLMHEGQRGKRQFPKLYGKYDHDKSLLYINLDDTHKQTSFNDFMFQIYNIKSISSIYHITSKKSFLLFDCLQQHLHSLFIHSQISVNHLPTLSNSYR